VALNRATSSKVLATVMSDPFKVFSAKKFPGMIESTPLSKAFAGQGIRIPVRHGNNDQSRSNGNNASTPPDAEMEGEDDWMVQRINDQWECQVMGSIDIQGNRLVFP
jgi:hypothetical protein